MNKTTQRWLFWSPRVLCILFAVFISLFALDVFGAGYGFWETLVAVLIHLLPTWIILAVLLAAWRWERIGGALFILLAGGFAAFYGGRTHWLNSLLLFAPLIVVGVLFLVDGGYRMKAQR